MTANNLVDLFLHKAIVTGDIKSPTHIDNDPIMPETNAVERKWKREKKQFIHRFFFCFIIYKLMMADKNKK